MNILRVLSTTSSHVLNFVREQLIALNEAFRLPMATSIRTMRGLLICLLVGLFVAVVAVGVQPFGLDLFNHDQKTWFLLGFGVVATFAMLIAKFVLPIVFPKFYNQQQWTIARQSLHFLVIVLLLTSSLVAYANFFEIVSYKVIDILKVFVLSIIPVIVTTFIQQRVFQNKFMACAEIINQHLHSHADKNTSHTPLVLVLGKKGEQLSLVPNQLIYIENTENTSDIYWQNFMGVEKTTLHTAIKEIEKELLVFPQFVRLHKNFIINIKGIHQVEGDARGYHLRVARSSKVIPVSWKFHKKLEQLARPNQ